MKDRINRHTIKLCNCNATMSLDGAALGKALGRDRPMEVHTALCRKQAGAFEPSLSETDVVVACTQEAGLFSEIAEDAQSDAKLRFVNIREAAGRSAERDKLTPKIAALLAAAALPEPEPVASVDYKSAGQLLIIGPSAVALDWAKRLSDGSVGHLDVSVLMTRLEGGELPAERDFPVWSGKSVSVSGYLGAFEVEWSKANPIDLDVCTRCNACIEACPEGAIDFLYQIDADRCKNHRQCVDACGQIGAISFDRGGFDRDGSDRDGSDAGESKQKEHFDLVLDLSAEPHIRVPDLPQGYLAPASDPLEQALAAARLAQLVGEFEKPRFTRYNDRICAHGRSGRSGCNRCVDVCSTGAIRSDGERVVVDAHVCAGCGGCATVCPSGAMSYEYARVPDMGLRLKTLLSTYCDAGGEQACLLFHDLEEGSALVNAVGRHAVRGRRGLPARVIPVATFHAASIGIDVLLGAICYGASQVMIVSGSCNSDTYLSALEAQMFVAQTILNGLGYAGEHFKVLRLDASNVLRTDESNALESMLWDAEPAVTVAKTASFNLAAEKRTSLDLAIDHLARLAPAPVDEIALSAGAPFGALVIDRDKCTMCMACVGACPASALQDAPETPQLRFVERNCVQCGLCVNTCPEKAIKLQPRLLLTAQAKTPVVVNEAEPFDCVRCGKPFGTKRMVDNMLSKLDQHSMFTGGEALKRLQMCAECRVVDMVESNDERSIFDYAKGK
jgi:ferredoxin